MTDTRQHVHELIDQLPPAQLAAVETLLESFLDPVAAALRNAPFDDEPETEAERIAVAEARESLKRNGGIPFEQAVAELGFTLDELTSDQDPA